MKYLFFFYSFLFLSCNFDKANKNTLNNMYYKYVTISEGSDSLLFVFDKNLQHGDKTASLFDQKGNLIINFKEHFKNDYVVTAKLKNNSILISLLGNKFAFFNLKDRVIKYYNNDEFEGRYISYEEYNFINDSTIIYQTSGSYNGNILNSINLISLNLFTGQKTPILSNADNIRYFKNQILYSKDLKYFFSIDKNQTIKKIINFKESALILDFNDNYYGILKWKELSDEIESLKKMEYNNSDKLFEISKIRTNKNKINYFFEMYRYESMFPVLKLKMPIDNCEINELKIISDKCLLFDLYDDYKNINKILLLSTNEKRKLVLSGDIYIISITNDFLFYSNNERYFLLNINNFSQKELKVIPEISEEFMNKGNDKFYYFCSYFEKSYNIYCLDYNLQKINLIKKEVL
jgi:hypothetical protein